MRKKTDEILNDCFTQLSKVEDVCIHNYFVKEHKEYIQAWRLTTTISIRDAVAEDIIFILGFKNTFPYTLPDIYYYDKRYDYFPHIDYNNRKLCLYNENIVFSTSNPYQLIRAIIKRAKQIIQNGTSEHCDNFHDEIINYWDLIYGNEPPIEFGWIHTISSFDHSRLLKLYSSEYLEQYNCRACIVDSDNNIEYIKYFKAKFGSKFIEHNALFLANINIPATPPYSITTDIFSSWITSEEDSKKYHHYLRTEPGLLIILFRLGDTNLLGGFIYGNINTNRNGFRKGKLTRYDILTGIERNKPLRRLLVYEYSKQRIALRTAGRESKMHQIAIAGLGSIGSYLCHFLNSLNSPKFLLVDNDVFNVNNIGRHLLGFNYLNRPKVDGIRDYLKAINPNQEIITYRGGIESYITEYLCDINKYDILILCTGHIMSELFVLELVESKQLNIPIIIIWLEPYGIAGHVVYIDNWTGASIKDKILSNNMLYRYNIIKDEEYCHKEFTMKDAGCNGEYTLYSGNDVMLFLSAIYPVINRLLNSRRVEKCASRCFRWIGDTAISKEKDIQLKDIEIKPYEITEYII